MNLVALPDDIYLLPSGKKGVAFALCSYLYKKRKEKQDGQLRMFGLWIRI